MIETRTHEEAREDSPSPIRWERGRGEGSGRGESQVMSKSLTAKVGRVSPSAPKPIHLHRAPQSLLCIQCTMHRGATRKTPTGLRSTATNALLPVAAEVRRRIFCQVSRDPGYDAASDFHTRTLEDPSVFSIAFC